MPQMAPMNWVSLLIMFITIFLMFNSMNYFMFKYQNKTYSTKTNKFFFNWKW
uniref:ATP synthase complex subunit 8 n=1 Tax=Elmidae sp. BMNH 840216 TaxID=904145 RepID=E3VT47_9COLE|nr:ATP synthase F0 subunit 8 [Elmidae sp. BMNH 840216]